MQWAEIESCDMFQTSNYCGGFDADEQAFCFSYFDPNNQEFWFQIDLQQVKSIANNLDVVIIGRKAGSY